MKISELIVLLGLVQLTDDLSAEEQAEVHAHIKSHKNYKKYVQLAARQAEPDSQKKVKGIIRRWDKLLTGMTTK